MLSSFCMLFAFLLLTIKVTSQNSAAGVSSRSLEMWLLTLFTRMSSTLIKRGYLPEDRTGDYLYQVPDDSYTPLGKASAELLARPRFLLTEITSLHCDAT